MRRSKWVVLVLAILLAVLLTVAYRAEEHYRQATTMFTPIVAIIISLISLWQSSDALSQKRREFEMQMRPSVRVQTIKKGAAGRGYFETVSIHNAGPGVAHNISYDLSARSYLGSQPVTQQHSNKGLSLEPGGDHTVKEFHNSKHVKVWGHVTWDDGEGRPQWLRRRDDKDAWQWGTGQMPAEAE